jgi:uncharacterized protein (DUF1330 family)
MSVYMVFSRHKTVDADSLERYAELIMPTFETHSVKVLAAYGECEVIEGEPIESAVILEFPSFEEARAWYGSPIYADIRPLRFNGALYSGFMVEGV